MAERTPLRRLTAEQPPAPPPTAPPVARRAEEDKPKAPDLKVPIAAPPAHESHVLPQITANGGRVTASNLDVLRATVSATATVPGIGITDMPVRTLSVTVRAPQDRHRLAHLLEAMAAQLKS